MTFTQLRTFIAVVDAGSVHRAAGLLGVTAPAVSGAVGALQRELGVTLLERDGRGVRVTGAGTVYAEYARRILRLTESAGRAAMETLDATRGRVRLAAVTTAGERVLPPYLATFRTRFPDAELSLEVGNRDRVWHALDHDEVDLAIAGRPPAGGRFASLAARPNLLVMVAAGSGASSVRDVDVDQLASEVVLMREQGSGTRSTAEQLLDELGIAPTTLTFSSNGAIRESVGAGLGITLISRDAVARELAAGTLEEWRCPPLPYERAWHAVTRRNEQLPPTTALFLDHLVEGGDGGDGLGAGGPARDGEAAFTLVGPPAPE